MNSREVLERENVGKEYKFEEQYTYEVVESFSGNLNLKNIDTYEYIEYEISLIDIINGDFKEIVDWSRVPVDAKILVSDNGKVWCRRYFAKYEGGLVYAFMDGATSFTGSNESLLSWKYAKLYEE